MKRNGRPWSNSAQMPICGLNSREWPRRDNHCTKPDKHSSTTRAMPQEPRTNRQLQILGDLIEVLKTKSHCLSRITFQSNLIANFEHWLRDLTTSKVSFSVDKSLKFQICIHRTTKETLRTLDESRNSLPIPPTLCSQWHAFFRLLCAIAFSLRGSAITCRVDLRVDSA